MKPVNTTIRREVILQQIDTNLRMCHQWLSIGILHSATQYLNKAEVLVELLEVDDCGSVGGFDRKRNQPPVGLNTSPAQVKQRYDWLRGLPITSDK